MLSEKRSDLFQVQMGLQRQIDAVSDHPGGKANVAVDGTGSDKKRAEAGVRRKRGRVQHRGYANGNDGNPKSRGREGLAIVAHTGAGRKGPKSAN